jgi:hypothetical protein
MDTDTVIMFSKLLKNKANELIAMINESHHLY